MLAESKTAPVETDDMQAFLMVLRQALLMIVVWIERKYGLERKH